MEVAAITRAALDITEQRSMMGAEETEGNQYEMSLRGRRGLRLSGQLQLGVWWSVPQTKT